MVVDVPPSTLHLGDSTCWFASTASLQELADPMAFLRQELYNVWKHEGFWDLLVDTEESFTGLDEEVKVGCVLPQANPPIPSPPPFCFATPAIPDEGDAS